MLKPVPSHLVTLFLVAASPSAVPITSGLDGGILNSVAQVLAPTGGPISLQHQLLSGVEHAIGPIVLVVPGLILGVDPLAPTSPLALPRLVSGPVVPVAVLLDVSGELEAALAFPSWMGTVIKYAGLCTWLLGVMAWMTGFSDPRRHWGRRTATLGAGLTIVGFAFDVFINVVKYVLTG